MTVVYGSVPPPSAPPRPPTPTCLDPRLFFDLIKRKEDASISAAWRADDSTQIESKHLCGAGVGGWWGWGGAVHH